jgi:hypothetical protein
MADWGELSDASQTVSSVTPTTLLFSNNEDSGGTITADAVDDDITVSENGFYEHHLWVNATIGIVGAGTTWTILGGLTITSEVDGGTNQTFSAMSIDGTQAAGGTVCNFAFAWVEEYIGSTPHTLQINVNYTASSNNISINNGHYIVRRVG